jgi:hypothetical protein
MSSKHKQRGSVFWGLLGIALGLGWIYYMWICVKFKLVGWALAGVFLAPGAMVVGLWSFLFGVPWFMLPSNI